MAHNIHRKADGTWQALYVGKPAWHGLGEVVSDALTPEQVYRRVFDKRVIILAPAYTKVGRKFVEVPETRFTMDKATGQVYAPVSAEYAPIQDLDALRIPFAIAKASRKRAAVVSAFALGNGATGAATVDLTRLLGEKHLQVLRDKSAMEAYLFVTWSHDGTGAVRASDAINRVDCNNMLNAAISRAESKGRLVRIVHSGSESTVQQQLEEAQRILGFATDDIKAQVKLLNAFADISLPKPDKWWESFTELLIPIPADMERPVAREEARGMLTELWQHSKTLVGVPKSPYRAVQAVAEYGDHYRNIRVGADRGAIVPEKRFRSITEGPSADLKARAIDLIRQEFEVKVPVRVR